VFSLQQILGHATLDMVRRYVTLSEAVAAQLAFAAESSLRSRRPKRSPITVFELAPDSSCSLGHRPTRREA